MELPKFEASPRDPFLKDLYKESEYLRRHLPLSRSYFMLFTSILEPQMPEDFLQMLGRGAELHDLGKRACKGFLEKPEFTQQERELMHWHPIIGSSFLTSLYGKNHPWVVMAGGHHLRFDGKGYPDDTKGEDIPYFARIMAIADVFVTVTQKRPYESKVFTPIEALGLLEEEAGKVFDPTMVGAIVQRLQYELS